MHKKLQLDHGMMEKSEKYTIFLESCIICKKCTIIKMFFLNAFIFNARINSITFCLFFS